MDELRRLLRTYTDIEVFENRFDSEDGIDGLGENPFVSQGNSLLNDSMIHDINFFLCFYVYRRVKPGCMF